MKIQSWVVVVLCLFVSGLYPVVAGSEEAEIVCFVYHRFGDDRYPSTNISIEAFRAQMAFLKQEQIAVWTLGEAVARLRTGLEMPEKVAVLTVDDGYKSFLTGAVPVLREFGFSATLFVNASSVGSGAYLDWADLHRLAAEGIEIGNHSARHPYFLNIPKNERLSKFRQDVQEAQQEIEDRLGIQSKVFSYPYGEYDLEMREGLEEMGFDAAAAQNSGVVYRGSDLYTLPRFPMGGPYATVKGFREKVGMRALRVVEQEPVSPVLDEAGPPALRLRIDLKGINPRGIQCFVDGRRACTIEADTTAAGWFIVRATHPLNERRVLYTVTAPSMDGKTWHWFSHLWVRPEVVDANP